MVTPTQRSSDISYPLTATSYVDVRKIRQAAYDRFKLGIGLTASGILLNALSVVIKFANAPDSARIALSSTACVMLVAGFGLTCHAQSILYRRTPVRSEIHMV